MLFAQRDTNGLTAENSELKLRLQTTEQQVHLQDGKSLISYIVGLYIYVSCLGEYFLDDA